MAICDGVLMFVEDESHDFVLLRLEDIPMILAIYWDFTSCCCDSNGYGIKIHTIVIG